MKLVILISVIILSSCTSQIYLNPDYSSKLKNKSLAIIDINSYNNLLEPHIVDSLTKQTGNLLISPPLRCAIEKQSYFSKVNYVSINSVDNFRLHQLDLPKKKLNLFLPQTGSKIQIDSMDYDFVLFAYVPYDSTINENSATWSLLGMLFNYNQGSTKSKSEPVKLSTSELTPPMLVGPKINFADKYTIENLSFVIWDNQNGDIVNYGNFDRIWKESYKKVILETGRMVLIKSPFYKRMPPR